MKILFFGPGGSLASLSAKRSNSRYRGEIRNMTRSMEDNEVGEPASGGPPEHCAEATGALWEDSGVWWASQGLVGLELHTNAISVPCLPNVGDNGDSRAERTTRLRHSPRSGIIHFIPCLARFLPGRIMQNSIHLSESARRSSMKGLD